jgi:hypothetical protein
VLLLNTINPEITSLKALQLDGLTIKPQVYDPITPAPDSVGGFCDTAKFCDICASVDTVCKDACTSKEGIYSAEFHACAHNKQDPGVDLGDLDPDLNNQLSGTVTQITGGLTQVNNDISKSGKTELFRTAAYPSEEFLYTRRNNIQDCIDDGGTSYMVFYGPQSEMFVCLK